jgi:mono/diheme cytochrome c family protein
MTYRRVFTGTAAAALLLAASSLGTPAWAQKWECPAAEKGKKPSDKIAKEIGEAAKAAAAGKKLTSDKACTACHGETGKGDGPGAAALNPKPANWTSAAVQSESDGCLFWKISTGRGAMPPWASLAETERWQLIQFLRTLKAK